MKHAAATVAPKVGDTVFSYAQIKQLPEGTFLSYTGELGNTLPRFVRHHGDIVELVDENGSIRNRVRPGRPYTDVSYIVKAIPAPKVGDTVTTYEELCKLPDGTVLGYCRLGVDEELRFVQHHGESVKLLNEVGFVCNWVGPAGLDHSETGFSYLVKSIPETTN